jgi:CheY-like chemotaxis protein
LENTVTSANTNPEIQPPGTSSSEQPLVFVVEDDEEQLIILRMLLADAGYNVITETDADKVLESARNLVPDIVLMDVMLPSRIGLDGFVLCSQIRKEPGLEKCKVIMVSAIAQGVGSQREKVMEQVGAHDFILKPYDPPVLIDRIRSLINS